MIAITYCECSSILYRAFVPKALSGEEFRDGPADASGKVIDVTSRPASDNRGAFTVSARTGG